MSKCQNCNADMAQGAAFCPVCGAKAAVAQQSFSQKSVGGLHCPQCGSRQISPINETSVNGAVTTGNGRMAATRVSTIHRNYWMCSNCGTKFRNIQSLEEEIGKTKPMPVIYAVLAVIGLVISIYLIVNIKENPIGGIFLGTFAIGAVIATVVFIGLIFAYVGKLKKLRAELAYLKQNCFN